MTMSSRLAFLVFAALAAAPVAGGAEAGFKGNVCALVPARQVTAIGGVSSRCANAKPSPGPGSTIYVGNWAGLTSRSPTVQVTVAVYTDTGLLARAKQNLGQGLPGPPRRVPGIGSAAFEAKGAGAVGIHVSVGAYIAYISLNAIGKPPKSAAVLEPLAKAVAARL